MFHTNVAQNVVGDLAHPAEKMLRGLATCSWPGRSQVFHLDDSKATLYLDGAHTLHSVKTCAEWFTSAAGKDDGSRKWLFFYSSHDRDVGGMLKLLRNWQGLTLSVPSCAA